MATWAALDALDLLIWRPDIAYRAGESVTDAITELPGAVADGVGAAIEGVGNIPEIAGDLAEGTVELANETVNGVQVLCWHRATIQDPGEQIQAP